MYVAPFSPQQIDHYVAQYLTYKHDELEEQIQMHPEWEAAWLEKATYLQWIRQIPGLEALVKTPFLLRITMEVLPLIVMQYQAAQTQHERFMMTGAKLYDEFMTLWFNRQEEKLIGQDQHPGENLQSDYWAFAKQLAKQMYEQGVTQVTFQERSQTDLTVGGQKDRPWDKFFSERLVAEDRNNPQLQQIRLLSRIACPLRKVGPNQYGFLHLSLLEYFFSRDVFDQFLEKGLESLAIAPPPVDPLAYRKTGHTTIQGQQGTYELVTEISQDEAKTLKEQAGYGITFEQSKRRLDPLGRGEFGKVCIARHQTSGRFCVVKKIKHPQQIAASQQETRLQGQLTGLAHIMPLWDYRETVGSQGQPVLYVFMPLAQYHGKNIEEVLQQLRQAPVAAAIKTNIEMRLIRHVAHSLLVGLAGMHSRGIFHLDIKAKNYVLDAKERDKVLAIVVDFC